MAKRSSSPPPRAPFCLKTITVRSAAHLSAWAAHLAGEVRALGLDGDGDLRRRQRGCGRGRRARRRAEQQGRCEGQGRDRDECACHDVPSWERTFPAERRHPRRRWDMAPTGPLPTVPQLTLKFTQAGRGVDAAVVVARADADAVVARGRRRVGVGPGRRAGPAGGRGGLAVVPGERGPRRGSRRSTTARCRGSGSATSAQPTPVSSVALPAKVSGPSGSTWLALGAVDRRVRRRGVRRGELGRHVRCRRVWRPGCPSRRWPRRRRSSARRSAASRTRSSRCWWHPGSPTRRVEPGLRRAPRAARPPLRAALVLDGVLHRR